MITRRNASLPIRPVRVFDAGDQDKNRRIAQLERSHQDVARRLDQNKHDRPRPTGDVKRANCNAAFGDHLKLDPSAGGFTVTLPRPTQADAGKQIWLKNTTSSTNQVVLRPMPPARIETSDTAVMLTAYGQAVLTTDGKDYWAT